jgi:hypothetical protein
MFDNVDVKATQIGIQKKVGDTIIRKKRVDPDFLVKANTTSRCLSRCMKRWFCPLEKLA